MAAAIKELDAILASPRWTPAEKLVVQWQFGMLGDFETQLFKAIDTADESNQARLERGFPEHVSGYRAWIYGNLGNRLRAAGLDI